VRSHPADQNDASAQELAVQYVGPGANAVRVALAPKTSSVVAPASVAFTARVYDAGDPLIPNVPLAWSISDPNDGTVSSSGPFTPSGRRGTVTITARTPTNVSDIAALSITLPVTGVALVSGAGQSGRVGTLLSQGASVRVVASDGAGVAGAT